MLAPFYPIKELNYQCCSSQLASCCAAGFSVLNSSTIGLGLNFEYRCVQGDSLMRILCIGAFAVSGYSSTEGRTCKPFNPLLGETYEADFPDMGVRFVSEKVSLMSHLNFAKVNAVISSCSKLVQEETL
jgi:hypothetical protein